MTFLLLFAFAQFVGIGNYNYLCPYAHELTHGFLLGWLALLSVWRLPVSGLKCLIGAGFALGLSFLTKAEVFHAGAIATLFALVLVRPPATNSWRHLARDIALVLGAFCVPPLLAVLWLQSAMPAQQAFAGVAGTWLPALDPTLTHMPFYREGMGIYDVKASLLSLGYWLGIDACTLTALVVLALALGRFARYRRLAALALLSVISSSLWLLGRGIAWRHWEESARPLPFLMLAFLVVGFRAYRGTTDPARRMVIAKRLSISVFGLCLLAKMILNTRIVHYGFVLAVPATLLVVVALLDFVPAALARIGGAGEVFRCGALGLMIGWTGIYLARQAHWVHEKTSWVGSGRDAFRADRRGSVVVGALDALARRSDPQETMAALPGGVMINYLARRVNPTGYTNLMPPEYFFFGERRILRSFKEDAPDLIALVDTDTSTFGFPTFGDDYGRPLAEWVTTHYRPVVTIGGAPLTHTGFGICLARRIASVGAHPEQSARKR